jgi:hypothetical protein
MKRRQMSLRQAVMQLTTRPTKLAKQLAKYI